MNHIFLDGLGSGSEDSSGKLILNFCEQCQLLYKKPMCFSGAVFGGVGCIHGVYRG